MNLLRLLSGLMAWTLGRMPKRTVRTSRSRTVALQDIHMHFWREHRPRRVPCQGKSCPLRDAPRSGYRHGWYSVENDKSLGHFYCALASGGTVRVTNVTNDRNSGLAGWPDAVYVGDVVPPSEGGIVGGHERFGKPWTPSWDLPKKRCDSERHYPDEDAKCKEGTCDHKDGPCADRRQANLIRRFQAATRG